jgi:FkbM family methyltransferase
VFPQAQILAIEPDAANAEVCRLNTQSLPNVKVIEAAIGSEPGLVSLNNPSGQAWAVQTTRSRNVGVPVRTITDLLNEVNHAKLFVAKIDIEGFEDDLFYSNTGWVDETEVIIIEPHDWMCPGEGTSFNFQQVLGGRNFELLISGENLIYIRLGNQRSQ